MLEPEPAYEVVQIRLSDLVPDPFQPRKTFRPEAIRDLAASIEQHGILQPLLVRPLLGPDGHGKYYIVAGERRYRAAQLVGLNTVPCHIRPYVTTTAAVAALAENVHREDLSELEKAESLFRIKNLTDKTWEQIAGMVSLSTDYVKRLAGLLKLEEAVKEWVRAGKISTRVAIALRPLPPRKQIEMAERAIREGLTAEQIRDEARVTRRPRSRRSSPETPDLSRALSSLDEPPEGTAPVKAEGTVVGTLNHLADAVSQMDAWLENREWSRSRVSTKQKQALHELRRKVGLLHQHLLAVCEPLREDPKAEAEKLSQATLLR
jgi:ParB family transcriptional regulator, chromosome partitioning protein